MVQFFFVEGFGHGVTISTYQCIGFEDGVRQWYAEPSHDFHDDEDDPEGVPHKLK